TYRVRTFEERGDNKDLGLPAAGVTAPLVDVLHRVLWLVDNAPVRLPQFLREANASVEQLRLVAQALCGPVLKQAESADGRPASELGVLSKLTANWRLIVEGAALSRETEERRRGQRRLPLQRTRTE